MLSWEVLVWLWVAPACLVALFMAFPPRSTRWLRVAAAGVNMFWAACMTVIVVVCAWFIGSTVVDWFLSGYNK